MIMELVVQTDLVVLNSSDMVTETELGYDELVTNCLF